ncbi:MAG: 2-amino-4-hydroxy-6-hydroxymethyldihydropteridine diphosphokinase [Rhodocyclaceae bacterium]|nr:2-amino-4-hydroxy-6-hydroxymethyldihydropteridine diphosphokinase [Rhodocyclaceae bacterium]
MPLVNPRRGGSGPKQPLAHLQTIAFLGLGSNLESPAEQVLRAFERIAATPGITLLRCSSLYRTAPIGYADQPDFVNAVVEVATTLTPEGLLAAMLEIEMSHGRVREFPNAPRTLDLDLLLYGDRVMVSEALTLPHPRAHQRAFVLHPLLEIAPHCHIPTLGPARDFLAACDDQGISRMPAPQRPLVKAA